MRQRAISALWFAGCCCCCSFWSSSGWPPSRRHRESWRLLLLFVALVCHKHSPKQSSVWSQKFQEPYLFIVYIYKLLSMLISHSKFFRVTIESKAVWSTTKDFSLLKLLLAAGRELMISYLNPYKVVSSILATDPNWCRCINFCFSNNHDCYWPKRPRVVVIDHHGKVLLYLKHVSVTWWLTFAPFMVAFRVRVLARSIFHRAFNFSRNHHPKYKTLVFIFKLISKKKYSIILKLEII